jgi:hypothetical protein
VCKVKETRNEYKRLARHSLGTPRRSFEDNIKMDPKHIGCKIGRMNVAIEWFASYLGGIGSNLGLILASSSWFYSVSLVSIRILCQIRLQPSPHLLQLTGLYSLDN